MFGGGGASFSLAGLRLVLGKAFSVNSFLAKMGNPDEMNFLSGENRELRFVVMTWSKKSAWMDRHRGLSVAEEFIEIGFLPSAFPYPAVLCVENFKFWILPEIFLCTEQRC